MTLLSLVEWFSFLELRWLYLYTLYPGSSFQISVIVIIMAAFPHSTSFSYSYLHISLFLLCCHHPGNTAWEHHLLLHVSFACSDVHRDGSLFSPWNLIVWGANFLARPLRREFPHKKTPLPLSFPSSQKQDPRTHCLITVFLLGFLKINFIFVQFLKVTFHLQLLQNNGYIAYVVQYILQPILHPIVCTSHLPTPCCPPQW